MALNNRISLGDIANEAKVSKATVSLALRGHPRIPEQTRERIAGIAKKLGYQPNPELSKVMATIKREPAENEGTLAFIRSGSSLEWESLEKFYFDQVIEGAASYGYRVEPYWIMDPRENPGRINNTMWNRGIEGIIIPMIHPELYSQGVRTLPIDWDKFSVVEIADTILEPKLNGVRHNHFGGMLQCLSELEALGYKRIGFCMEADVELRTHHRWTAAYLLWKTMRGLRDQLPVHFPTNYKAKPIMDWVEANQLDVIVSPGVEVYHTLLERQMRIPQEIGFATLHQWGPSSERTTGINQNMQAQALIAVEMLVSMIHRRTRGVPKNPIRATDPGYWSQGSTTRKPRRRQTVKPLDNEPLSSIKTLGKSNF